MEELTSRKTSFFRKLALWALVLILGPIALFSPVMLMSQYDIGHEVAAVIARLGWFGFLPIYLISLGAAYATRRRALGWVFILLPLIGIIVIAYADVLAGG